jgi:hypothetical protein
MTEERQPREREELDREPKPELDKEILEDLEPEQEQAEQLLGASMGCVQDKI